MPKRLVVLLSCTLSALLAPFMALAAPALELYGNLPGFETAALSQSGDRVALIGATGDARRLVVIDKNNKPMLSAALGDMKVRGLYWAGDDTVLVYKSDTITRSRLDSITPKAETYSMLVISVKGDKAWSVFANNRNIIGGINGFHGIRERGGRLFGYFAAKTSSEEYFFGMEFLRSAQPILYEVDLQTQDLRKASDRIEGAGYRDWIVGPDGTVSAVLTYYSWRGDWDIRNSSGDKIASGRHPDGAIHLIGLGATPATVVYSVEVNASGDVTWLELPLAGGEPKEVFADVAVSSTILDSRTLQIVGYREDADTPAYKFFSTRQQKVMDAAMRAFPGVSVHLKDWNDSFDKLLVMTEGTGDPQTWWMVDISTGRANTLGVSYPMRTQDVAPMRMIKYKATDGLDIAAVLTLPPGNAATHLPVVVLPHGGPRSRDYPGFDWWAQAFASRGYAVLQPNFRGSSGYGADFESAGHGEWGRKMQSDISEGLAHLVKEGIVDAKRACIMGAGYGGYAALAGVTLQKSIYRCAVSVAGVSDVQKMVSTNIEERGNDPMVRRALEEEVGRGKDLREVSPVRFASSADAPILLIHGKDDTVVPYDQSVSMANALKKAGKQVELVTLAGEDHWLSTSATRLAMLKAAMAFVEKHNPAGAGR